MNEFTADAIAVVGIFMSLPLCLFAIAHILHGPAPLIKIEKHYHNDNKSQG